MKSAIFVQIYKCNSQFYISILFSFLFFYYKMAELFNEFRVSADLVIRFGKWKRVTLVMDDRKLDGILRRKIYRNATSRKRGVIHFGMRGNAKEMKNAVVRYSYRWLSR